MSQFSRILSLAKSNKGKVFCGTLADEKLYHHASQRIGESKGKGYEWDFVKAERWQDSYYVLKSEPTPIAVGFQGEQGHWLWSDPTGTSLL